MAFILITDNPQGGACRCEGQEQALNLANLKPEQVEALKQALGINANASQGAGQADFSALSPEQIEALKQALGINASTAQALDINSLLKAEIDPSAFSEVEGAVNIEYSGIFRGGSTTAQVIWSLYAYNTRLESILGDLIQDLMLKGVISDSDYSSRFHGRMFVSIPD